MTFEHRITAGLSDITAIVFECSTCHARLALVPEDITGLPQQCPRGHAWDWNVPTQNQSMGSPILAFLHALKNLRGALIEKSCFGVALEYDARRWRTSGAE